MKGLKSGRWLVFLLVFLTLVSFVQASDHNKGVFDTLGNVVDKILDIGSLKFLGGTDNQFIGFVRILVGIMVFSLVYMGLSAPGWVPRNIATVIGIILAIITSVFLPRDILLLFGGTYATMFAFLLIGVPLLAALWLIIGTPTPKRWHAALKIAGLIILIYLISEIAFVAQNLGVAVLR